MENKKEQVIQGIQFAKNILNSITVMGVDNCSKLTMAYKNIEAVLNILASDDIEIKEKSTDIEASSASSASSANAVPSANSASSANAVPSTKPSKK